MKKNIIYFLVAGFLVSTASSCKKDNADSGLKAVFSYVADGYKVNFTNFSSNANEYQWEFGDGSGVTSDKKSPQHIFNRKGNFLVTLTAKNGTASSSFTDTVTIIGPNIKIDGDFSDWQYVDYTHVNADSYSSTLRAIKTFASSDMLYFYLEGTTDMNIELFDMYLDADNNPATGYGLWWYPAGSGADYLCEGPPVVPGWGGVFQHSGPPGGFTFSQVNTMDATMNFSAIKPLPGKKAIEFSLKKSALGTTSGFVNFCFVELTSGWADIGKIPETQLPGSKFIAIPL